MSQVEITGEEKDSQGKQIIVPYMTVKVTFSEMDLGTIWFMPRVKYGKIDLPSNDPNRDKLLAYIEVNSHSLSVMKIKMHSVARGSFLSIVKLHAFLE